MNQWLRKCSLVVANQSGSGLDLSGLRIKFTVKRTDFQTPNTADIRVWNVDRETFSKLQKEFTSLILQAGYEENYGVIFSGNIKQARFGKENGTDTYVDLFVADGDRAYNFSTVSTTLAAGSKPSDHINTAINSMSDNGVTAGYVDVNGSGGLPRGKVMYGMSRDYLRQSTESAGASWSIQDGKVQVIGLTSVLPNQAIAINSKSGMISAPEQTTGGITVSCLLNPMLKIGAKVQINESDVNRAKLVFGDPFNPGNMVSSVASDGLYRVLSVTHSGDTRGQDWKSDIVCLDVDATSPISSQVKLNG